MTKRFEINDKSLLWVIFISNSISFLISDNFEELIRKVILVSQVFLIYRLNLIKTKIYNIIYVICLQFVMAR